MDFSNKTIWITGVTSGIGEQLAHVLAQRGARLVLSARREDKLRQVQQQLRNDTAHYVVPLDLANPEQVMATVRDELANIGTVDILINNAGMSQRSFAEETDFAVYRRLIEVNYLGTVAMTKALLPQMLRRGAGAIVSISSVAGKVGSQSRSGYSAAKHAIIGFMDSLRAEVANRSVQVIVACPGWVRTNISINALNARGEPENKMDHTIANGISAEQCAQAVVRALEKNKAEVIIGNGISRLAPTIKRFFPGFYRWMTGRRVYR